MPLSVPLQGGDPRFPITGEVRDPRFDFTPPDTQHNLRLNMTTQFFEGAFMCSAPSPLVPPGNINVTVLTSKCSVLLIP